jgi:hypothetical protein
MITKNAKNGTTHSVSKPKEVIVEAEIANKKM